MFLFALAECKEELQETKVRLEENEIALTISKRYAIEATLRTRDRRKREKHRFAKAMKKCNKLQNELADSRLEIN